MIQIMNFTKSRLHNVLAGIVLGGCMALPSLTSASTTLHERELEALEWLSAQAHQYLGVRYHRGGTDPSRGFDCSGLVFHLFRSSFGLNLPRRSEDMGRYGREITPGEQRPGDLVFFNTLRRPFSHVGIYIGEGRFIHSPSPGGVVRIEDMSLPYWRSRFNGVRRIGFELPA